jgi:hypothetical protein
MYGTRYSCQILVFETDFRKILKISIFMKIRPVGAKSFHAHGRTDGNTDTTKLIVTFCVCVCVCVCVAAAT